MYILGGYFSCVFCHFIHIWKHLHDRIIFTKIGGLGHKTSITPPPIVIDMPVPCHESDRSCICVFTVSIIPLFTTLRLDFRIVLKVLYFVFFISTHKVSIRPPVNIRSVMRYDTIIFLCKTKPRLY